MTHRSRVLVPKNHRQEHELRVITNPLLEPQIDVLRASDYQAPRTAMGLKPNSKWLVVRNNLHKIRSWAGVRRISTLDPRLQDWYAFFQMRRELRYAQQQIETIQSRPGFIPVHHFKLPIDARRQQRFNVKHIQSTDALYYPDFGKDPIVLQSLLYYFSEECAVPYESIFLNFLSNVCSMINHEEERHVRVTIFRRVALAIALVVFIILGVMFCSLILSVLKTTTNLQRMYHNDPDGGIDWRPPPSAPVDSGLTYL